VVAEGHVPTYSPKLIDPKAGPVQLALRPHDLDRRDPALVLRGKVLDEDGKPVPGAVVEPFGIKKANGAQFGGLRGIDALAVTDDRGEFRLGVAEKGESLYLKVCAPFLAPRVPAPLQAGPQIHEVTLVPGVTVTGAVKKDGKPVAGVALGLVQKNRRAERYTGDLTIATDAKGNFRFSNVPPDEVYVVYGLMDSCRPYGAIAVRTIGVGANGTTKYLGALEMRPGHRLTGQVVLADGKSVPAGTRVLLSREEAWDTQTVVAKVDGRFSFTGLPAERFTLHVRVPGYHISPKNRSSEFPIGIGLAGRVDRDIEGLRFLLEPGPDPRPDFGKLKQSDYQESERRRNSPLRGADVPSSFNRPAKLSAPAEEIGITGNKPVAARAEV
jgi:protocatechuate 3,4-dioxygenase beta subunit